MLSPREQAIRALSDPMGAIVPEQFYDLLLERITLALAECERATLERAAQTVEQEQQQQIEYERFHTAQVLSRVAAAIRALAPPGTPDSGE